MAINKTELSIGQSLENELKYLRRVVEELKNVQPLGADVLNVTDLPENGLPVSVGPVTIAASSTLTITITNTPTYTGFTIWNFLLSVFVDTYDYDYRWPSGSSLTSGQRSMNLFSWCDDEESLNLTGVRVFKIHIRNNDTVSHDYYVNYRAYLPTSPAAVS